MDTNTQPALKITRVFNAPRELVWKAWTEPEHLKHWWGPKNFSCPAFEIDFRVGGKYLACMLSPEGRGYWTTGVYREIIPLEKIVYTDNFADENGNIVPRSYYDMPGDLLTEFIVTVMLEEFESKTKMTLIHVGIPAGEMSDGAGIGWNQMLDRLAESLKY